MDVSYAVNPLPWRNSDAEFLGVLVHILSKFSGFLGRFAHRDRNATTKMSAGLCEPLARGALASLDTLGLFPD